MAIARTTGSLVGTDESTGVTIASNANAAGANADLLGDDASAGELELYLVFTSTVTTGSIDVTLIPGRRPNAGTVEYARIAPTYSVAPANATQKLYLGRIAAPRHLGATVRNNATGVNATNVSLLYALTKYT